MSSKRGQSLPLNTLIIIILIVITLIVVAVFFLGGTSSLSKSIRNIFFGTTAGTDIDLARRICEQRCEAAASAQQGSQFVAYCTVPFKLDTNNDGKADEGDSYCDDSNIGVSCSQYGTCSGHGSGATWSKSGVGSTTTTAPAPNDCIVAGGQCRIGLRCPEGMNTLTDKSCNAVGQICCK